MLNLPPPYSGFDKKQHAEELAALEGLEIFFGINKIRAVVEKVRISVGFLMTPVEVYEEDLSED